MVKKRLNQPLEILSNTDLGKEYHAIVFKAPEMAREAQPGQFCMLSAPCVLLRRPLSISGAANGRVEFLYRVVGKGTFGLSKLKPGEQVEVLGPLGRGYNLSAARNRLPVLVAGGTGIASVCFLAARLPLPGVLFYGAKTAQEVVALKEFRARRWRIVIATDDGTLGKKGFVTDTLHDELPGLLDRKPVLYCCGPHAMEKRVAEIAAAHGVPGYASLEETMACGVGICQGCVAKISGKHMPVCSEGPVFDMGEVEW